MLDERAKFTHREEARVAGVRRRGASLENPA